MKFFSVAAVAIGLSASSVSALFNLCLTQGQANQLASQYASIQAHTNSNLGTPSQTASKIFTSDYQEYSDSILALEGQPLGGPAFSGEQNYINAVLAQPALTGIQTLGVFPSGCDKYIWEFQFNNIGTYEVRGFGLFYVNSNLQIYKGVVEFNSLAYAVDVNALPCNGTAL